MAKIREYLAKSSTSEKLDKYVEDQQMLSSVDLIQ